MDIYGYPWIVVDINKFQQTYILFYGSLWNTLQSCDTISFACCHMREVFLARRGGGVRHTVD